MSKQEEEEKRWSCWSKCFEESFEKQRIVDEIVEKELTRNISILMKIPANQTITEVITNLQELRDIFQKWTCVGDAEQQEDLNSL